MFRRRLGMSAGGAGFRPSVFGGTCFAGGGGRAPALQGAALPPAAGDQRRRYRGRWLLFRWRLGMSAGGAGFRPSHVRWSVFCRRRGTSPSPTLGPWRCRRPVGDEGRRCRGRWLLFRWRLGMSAGGAGFPPSHVRWYVFRRRRGTSPSPTGGGVAAGGAGFPPSHVRWFVFRRRRGTSPSPTGGGVAAGGAGFPPSHVRWSVFRRRRGTRASPCVVFDSPCVAFGRATFLGRDNDPDEFESKTVDSWVRRSKSWRLRRHFRGACAVAEGYWLRIRSFDLV